jgi:hypothetical protein
MKLEFPQPKSMSVLAGQSGITPISKLLTLGAISSEVRKLDFKWYMNFIAFFGRTKTKRII